ncbi:hypothetical protein H072_4409 [Dactylellina haptotyla CBS 200.50]|uniref:Alpha/beta hydrolase fold-3 domain-containing protein n=1 Tax=Dactylellina haptotyla (strain CBS 200.50) TaxID=1284197 RepID=S8BQF7_DACHA|nr:hypothetical protein H072_4409 [Dactylellina haptotyla CBS 200.50]
MPTVFPPPPVLTRLKYLLRLLWMNNFVKFYLFLRRLHRVGYYKDKPTLTLSVPQRLLPSYWSPSALEIYLPKSYPSHTSSATSQPTKRLPLLIDIHGGGWCVGHPVLDSQFNRYLSDATNCIVVALAYRKSPYVQWPTQVRELTALVTALLQDDRITHLYDPSRVAIAGFSAGGNLSTVLAIQPEFQHKIQTIVPIYPIMDFTQTTEAKLATRPAHAPPDVLRHMGNWFSYGYIPLGTDREDPNLSPLFAKPESLPENIYLVGCEYDMLNADAIKFYDKFKDVKKNMVYEEIKTVKHGFTHQSIPRMDPKENERLDRITFALYDRIAVWLLKIWGEEKELVEEQEDTPAKETGDGELGDDIVIV